MRAEESKSAGFGGIGPVGTTQRFGITGCGTVTKSMDETPARYELSPAYFPSGRLNARSTPGLRRSPSISNVGAPNCASVTARFPAAVVFPSRGSALVIRITCGGCSACESKSEVRKDLNASETCDCGMEYDTNSTFISFPFADALFSSRDILLRLAPSSEPNEGTTAREGSFASLSMSSGVFTVLSMYSRRNARPRPPTSPTRNAIRILRARFGREGPEGTIAGSITRILDGRKPAEIPASFSFWDNPS